MTIQEIVVSTDKYVVSTDKYDFPGKKFYDYYTSVTLTCSWPGCGWEQLWYWDENMHQPFVDHFQMEHAKDTEQ